MLFFKYLPHLYQGADHSGRRVLNVSGGGSSAPTQTSQVSIPTYAKPYMMDLLGRADILTKGEYQPYLGEREAGPTATQLQAREQAGALTTPTQFGTATDFMERAGQAGLGASYDPTTFTADRVSAGDLTQYQAGAPGQVTGGLGSFTQAGTAEQFMSPYMQQVVEAQKQAATRESQLAERQAQLAAGTRTGALGSSAQTLAQAERERGLLDRLGQIQATGSQAAFDQAQKAFEAEQARGLQAGLQTQRLGTETDLANLQARLGVQELGTRTGLEADLANQRAALEAAKMSEQSRQFGSELGLRGSELGLRAGEGLGRLGAGEQAAELDRLKFMESMGQLSEADAQRLLDIKYQDFMAQQQHPYAQIGFMSDLLRGSSNLAGTGARSIYEAAPNPLQQMVGPGLLGLGLYREFNQ